jgi:hypothetical protein
VVVVVLEVVVVVVEVVVVVVGAQPWTRKSRPSTWSCAVLTTIWAV